MVPFATRNRLTPLEAVGPRGLDNFPCLIGIQSSIPQIESYCQRRVISWTAVASAGQRSRARHRFEFEGPAGIVDPETPLPLRAKAPSPRCSAGALHKRYPCRLTNGQTLEALGPERLIPKARINFINDDPGTPKPTVDHIENLLPKFHTCNDGSRPEGS